MRKAGGWCCDGRRLMTEPRIHIVVGIYVMALQPAYFNDRAPNNPILG
jgi:hypothetical protein